MGFSEILTLAAAGSAVCCGPLICPSLSSLHISGRRMGGPRETSCGLSACRPHWLQVLASKKVYMFFYGCIGIIKGMQNSYLSANLTTLEKRFGIKSKETAVLMSGRYLTCVKSRETN